MELIGAESPGPEDRPLEMPQLGEATPDVASATPDVAPYRKTFGPLKYGGDGEGPREGDTRINDAGNQEVLRHGRWQLADGKLESGEGGEPSAPPQSDPPACPRSFPKQVRIVDGRNIPQPQTRQEALKAGMKVRGTYQNGHTGWDIRVFKDAVTDSVFRHSRDWRAVLAIPQLLENAVLVNSRPSDNTARADVREVHEFFAPLQLGEDTYLTRLTVLERIDGVRQVVEERLRNVAPLKRRRLVPEAADEGETPSVSAGAEPPVVSIDQMLAAVKEDSPEAT